eukprot:179194-Amorphochlora_amoeboformis.AAC.1
MATTNQWEMTNDRAIFSAVGSATVSGTKRNRYCRHPITCDDTLGGGLYYEEVYSMRSSKSTDIHSVFKHSRNYTADSRRTLEIPEILGDRLIR